jgi:hypothetical protein
MKNEKNNYDLIVVGAGPAGMMAAIVAAQKKQRVLLLEKLPHIATKLKATGGGRCNLTNTLDKEQFMAHFGRDGRFMREALEAFFSKELRTFLESLGVETHAPDGFRVFPSNHKSTTIIDAMQKEMEKLGIYIICKQKVTKILIKEGSIEGVETEEDTFFSPRLVLATGGMGYPQLGAEGDGYPMVEALGHTTTPLYPAMMPLKVKESWVGECRADTLAKVEMKVALKKYKKLSAKGDLIFTKGGIRGPVVLDFSREITPLLEKFQEVPLLANFTKGMNEEQIRQHFKTKLAKDATYNTTLRLVESLLPHSVALALCHLAEVEPDLTLSRQKGKHRERLYQLLAWTPLTVVGHDGFKMAMITRGGIRLNEVNPHTMESKKIKGLFFCGEILNIDGPCGGYNLQWSFSSGYVAGEKS